MKTITTMQAALILAFGLLIGSALGIINQPSVETHTYVKTVPVPGPTVTKIVDRTSDRLPDACLMKFDDLDLGFSYTSKMSDRYTKAYDKINAYDWYEAKQALKSIKKVTRKFTKLDADYAEMQTLCHRVQNTTITE